MATFPHDYRVHARTGAEGDVNLRADGAPDLPSQAPPEFGGPPGYWSPETLLTAAVADCFALSFRAVAQANALRFDELACEVSGTLDRVDRRMRFTRFAIHAQLRLPQGSDEALARRLLEKAEHACLVSNSLDAEISLSADVRTA